MFRLAAAMAAPALLLTVIAWGPAPPAQAARRPTVVSLTFDDGTASQRTAVRILHAHGMAGTFYIITGALGSNGYLARSDLYKMAAAGEEIGGHTVSHLDLRNTTLAEVRRQVCQGRDTLLRWGFRVSSFAYPDGAYNGAVENIVRRCGFASARAVGGLRSGSCPHVCRAAESMPPADLYAVRSPGEIDASWTLADMERVVLTAERQGGGWVPFVFHHVCAPSACGFLSIPASTFDAFVSWLAGQRANGVVVRTVGQVVGGAARGPVTAAPAAPHGVVNSSLEISGAAGLTNPALETPDRSGAPKCWMHGGYGRNTVRWQRVRDAATGRWAVRLTMIRHRTGSAELLQLFDMGACSLPVTPGKSYQLSIWYKSTVRTQPALYYRDAVGRWRYWTAGPYFPATGRWTKATWQTPAIPPGFTGLSFGLTLCAVGTLVTDDYGFAPAPPNMTRTVLDGSLLAVVALIGVTGISRRLVRGLRRRSIRRRQPQQPR